MDMEACPIGLTHIEQFVEEEGEFGSGSEDMHILNEFYPKILEAIDKKDA